MAASLHSENIEELTEEEQIEKAIELSLDPSEQVNVEHQEFMQRFSSKKVGLGLVTKFLWYLYSIVIGGIRFLTGNFTRRLEGPGMIARPARPIADTSGDAAYARNMDLEQKAMAWEENRNTAALRREQEYADEEYARSIETGNALRNTYTSEDLEPKEEKFQTVVTKSKKAKRSPETRRKGELRPIIIDGLNIAKAYGLFRQNNFYDANGLKACYKYLRDTWNYPDEKITIVWKHVNGKFVKGQNILDDFRAKGIVMDANSQVVNGQRVTQDDDILALDRATKKRGVLISFDNFRKEYDNVTLTAYRDVIEKRVIAPNFDHSEVMLHPKPKGNDGPTLKELLTF